MTTVVDAVTIVRDLIMLVRDRSLGQWSQLRRVSTMKQTLQTLALVSVEILCCILVQDYPSVGCKHGSLVILQSSTTVVTNSNNKTLTTIKQSIQTASIVSVETIIAVF